MINYYPKGSDNWGWRDITGNPVVRATGGNRPIWTQISTGPFWAYKFLVNDELWFAYHIPHDIIPGTDIFFHVHWIPDGTDLNSVRWEFTYAYSLGFDQDAFDMDTGSTVTADSGTLDSGTVEAYRHYVTESAGVTISGLTEPDGLIYTNITRITNGGSDNTDDIFLLTADLHYESNNIATASKAPDFYI